MQLNAKRKNPWQAPPLTHFETVFTKKEKINEDINPNTIRVSLKTSESLSKADASYLKLSFQVSETQELTHHFDLKTDQTMQWPIDEQLFKTIDKKEVTLALKNTTLFFFKSVLEEKKFKMSELSAKCSQTRDIQFNNSKATCQITFSIRQPLKGKELEEIPTQKLVIDTFIEPFRGEQP